MAGPKQPDHGSASTRIRKRTRWWAYVALAVVALAAWPLWRYNVYQHRLSAALSALESADFSAAISGLEAHALQFPESAEVAYWLAVAHRRAGHLEKFEGHIQRARGLGFAEEEVNRQWVLLRMQIGARDEDLQNQVDRLIVEGSERNRDLRLYIDEFYEAQVRGYVANFLLTDAEMALKHWVGAYSDSVAARFQGAQFAEIDGRYTDAEDDYGAILKQQPDHRQARLQFAKILLHNQKVSDAVREFQQCETDGGDEYIVQMGLAECEFREGKQVERACQRIEALLARDLSSEERAQSLMKLALIMRSLGNHQRVIDLVKEAIRLSPPRDTTPFSYLVGSYSALGMRREAEECRKDLEVQSRRGHEIRRLTGLITKDPVNADYRFQIGKLVQASNVQDEAAAWWLSAVRFDPRHQAAHLALAEHFAAKGSAERAAEHEQAARQAARVTFERGWEALANGDLAAAREKLELISPYKELKHECDLLTLGLNIVTRKDLDITVTQLQRLTAYSHLRLKALDLIGEALYLTGNIYPAQDAFVTVLRDDADDVIAHRWLQAINYDLGAYERMQIHALRVAALDKTDHRPHRMLGFVKKESEQWEAAISDYQESLKRNPNQPTAEEVRTELAECQWMAGFPEEALATLQKVSPSLQAARIKAECYLATRRAAEAKRLIDEALAAPALPPAKAEGDAAAQSALQAELASRRGALLVLRGDIALVEKEPQQAREFLEKAIEENPRDPSAHNKLSAVLVRLGDREGGEREAKIGKELLEMQSEYSEANMQAAGRPSDIGLRRKLADLAKKLGRDEDAERWTRMAEMMDREQPAAKPGQRPSPLSIAPDALREKGPIQFIEQAKPEPRQPTEKPGPVADSDGSSCSPQENTREREAAEKKEEPLFSGPQKGEKLPGFKVKTVLGEGKEIDLVAEADGKPTLLIFVHEITRPGFGLAKALANYAVTRKKDGLASGIVFLSADPTEMATRIKAVAGYMPKEMTSGIAEGGAEGPGALGLNRKVEMTIIIAKEGKVVASFALVQPSAQADGPKILKEIVDVLGGGKVPAIEELMRPMEMRREKGKEPERKKDGEKEGRRDGERGSARP